jgi:hypothetical protein
MRKKLIILSIFTLISISNANELNLFKTISISDTLREIINRASDNSVVTEEQNQTTMLLIDMNMGDSDKGKKLYSKKLQKYCEMSGTSFAGMYSQDEWEEIVEVGKFSEEVIEICPKLKEIYDNSWSPNLYQFAYEYANDSGNVPTCS